MAEMNCFSLFFPVPGDIILQGQGELHQSKNSSFISKDGRETLMTFSNPIAR